MAPINVGRVVRGGLVAGVVANVIDFVTNTYLLAADWAAFAPTRNLDPAAFNNGSIVAVFIAIDFIFGLALVWTYAAMRPRFGAGPKTAILAGLVLYVTVTAVLFGFAQLGLMSMTLWVKGSLYAIVSTFAASLAGAAVYKEEVAPTGPAYAR